MNSLKPDGFSEFFCSNDTYQPVPASELVDRSAYQPVPASELVDRIVYRPVPASELVDRINPLLHDGLHLEFPL